MRIRTKGIQISLHRLRKDIAKVRDIWLDSDKRGVQVSINRLDPRDSLMLINKILTESGYPPVGLCLRFILGIGCNANCIMCDPRLKTRRSNRSFQNISELLAFVDRETVSNISILGGEPLLDKKGLIDFIKKASSLDFKITLTTNCFFMTKSVFDELVSAGLSDIAVSLDSWKGSEHDDIRGIKGLFSEVIGILKYIKKAYPRFPVSINSVIMKRNLSSISGLIQLAAYFGYPLNLIYVAHNNRPDFSSIELKRKELDKIEMMKKLSGLRRAKIPINWDACNPHASFACFARYLQLDLDEDGSLIFCPKYRGLRQFKLKAPLKEFLLKKDVRGFFTDDRLHCRNFGGKI